jgi:hypothetical protein
MDLRYTGDRRPSRNTLQACIGVGCTWPFQRNCYHRWRWALWSFMISNFSVFWMLYSFFWVIPWHLKFMCWYAGTLYQFHLYGRLKWQIWSLFSLAYVGARHEGVVSLASRGAGSLW